MNRPSSSLSCKFCGEPITFDDKHISQRTGKKIPLDVETREPKLLADYRDARSKGETDSNPRKAP